MKKLTAAVAVIVIAAAGFAEYRFFIQNPAPENEISISLAESAAYQGNALIKNETVVIENSEGIKCEYESVPSSETDYSKIAVQLLTNLEKIEKMSVCDMRVKKDYQTESDGIVYYKSGDRYFRQTEDVNTYMSLNLTSSLIESRYSGITGGDSPVLIDYEGSVYVKDEKNESGILAFSTDEDGVITFELNYTAPDSFSVSSGGHTFIISEDCDLWKIASID